MTAPDSAVSSVTRCRLCGGDLIEVLDLGLQPLPNRLPLAGDPEDVRHPLRLVQCQQCRHLQLGNVVPPETMFTDYLFHSGVSTGWRVHCGKLAKRLRRTEGLAVDIGSNDGTMLHALNRCGFHVLGIDPMKPDHPYPVEQVYFSLHEAQRIREYHGPADFITAMNVLGHVYDPIDFLKGVAHLLHPDGTAYIEVPYVGVMLCRGTYDQIYHEHIHYWSVSALIGAALQAGLGVVSVEHVPVHGGSLRVRLRHGSFAPQIEDETRLLSNGAMDHFRWMVGKVREEIGDMLKMADHPIWAYGASAKGVMLLNTIPALADSVSLVVDDTPVKQGRHVPGCRLPIGAPDDLCTPRTLVLTAWNWAEDIKCLAKDRGFMGRFLTPFPEPRWV